MCKFVCPTVRKNAELFHTPSERWYSRLRQNIFSLWVFLSSLYLLLTFLLVISKNLTQLVNQSVIKQERWRVTISSLCVSYVKYKRENIDSHGGRSRCLLVLQWQLFGRILPSLRMSGTYVSRYLSNPFSLFDIFAGLFMSKESLNIPEQFDLYPQG